MDNYMTVKEVYENLCVTRNSIIKKLDLLENMGYVKRFINKRPEIYISVEGYEFLKNKRINYIEELINNEKNEHFKKRYVELKEAIGNPEVWSKYHSKEYVSYIYVRNNNIF